MLHGTLATVGAPVLDLPAVAVAWGLATWWAARWLSPERRGGAHARGSADGAAQEATHTGAGQQRRGGHQRPQYHGR